MLAILKALPEILALIKEIQKLIDAGQTQLTVNQHVQQVTEAFKDKDASKLDALFNTSST